MNDNVRKIFDMLGVEPEEWFKLKDRNGKYCINKSLYGYRIDECNEGSKCDWILSLVLYNPENIIKLPKEPKKKKLRDLTKEEFINFCAKYDKDCLNCPFHNVHCNTFYEKCWVYHKDLYSDKFLDQEIEVEE